MDYYSSFRTRKRRRLGPMVGTLGVVLVLGAVFAYGVYYIRFGRKTNAPEAVASTSAPGEVPLVVEAPTQAKNATLADVTAGSANGEANRGEKDGNYDLTIKADLPDIDRNSQYYDVWLVRKIPYDFFPAGEMVTNNLGEFVLEWVGQPGDTYDDYTQVVVTLQTRGEDPSPAKHVLEGEFTDH